MKAPSVSENNVIYMRTSIKQKTLKKIRFCTTLFCPAEQTPQVLENLWQQTLAAYVNNPLSAVFKKSSTPLFAVAVPLLHDLPQLRPVPQE